MRRPPARGVCLSPRRSGWLQRRSSGRGGGPRATPAALRRRHARPGRGDLLPRFSDRLAWEDARDDCVAWQGELAKVETPEEDTFLGTLLSRSIWLGASDTVSENVFQWTDGTRVTLGVWGPNQPDRFPGADCVEKRDTWGRFWFDQPCFNERAFVREKPVEP